MKLHLSKIAVFRILGSVARELLLIDTAIDEAELLGVGAFKDKSEKSAAKKAEALAKLDPAIQSIEELLGQSLPADKRAELVALVSQSIDLNVAIRNLIASCHQVVERPPAPARPVTS